MKGRVEPQNDTDEQCEHCGLWYSRRGVLPHERNCDLRGVDAKIQTLESEGTPSDDRVPPEPNGDGTGEGVSPDSETGTVDLEDVEVDVDDEPEPEHEPEPTLETDGSGLGLGGPPETPDVEDDDVEDDEPDTDDCPECGEDTEMLPDEFDRGTPYECTECGATWEGRP